MKKVNPKILKKGLIVEIIRGRNKGLSGEVVFWHEPTKEDPSFQIDVRSENNKMSYLGLGDIRLS